MNVMSSHQKPKQPEYFTFLYALDDGLLNTGGLNFFFLKDIYIECLSLEQEVNVRNFTSFIAINDATLTKPQPVGKLVRKIKVCIS